MWDEQWDDFARRYQAIRFDMRGFGKSDPAQAPITRRNDLHRLLKQLPIARTALLGCSMGGRLSSIMRLNTRDGLGPDSSPLFPVVLNFEPPRYLMEMMGAIEQNDLALASELQNRIWIDGPFRQPSQVDPLVRQRAAEMNRIALANKTFSKVDASPHNPLNPPAAHRLGEIRIPTLIIAGALDDPEILRAAEVMATAIPGARKVIIPGCAHLPNMEKPAQFNQVVLEFLHSLKWLDGSNNCTKMQGIFLEAPKNSGS
jgi:pimeloyl-ACP methyl ester carboxylesterase